VRWYIPPVFFWLSKILDVFLGPLTWSVVLVFTGLVWNRRRPHPRWFALSGLAVLLLFSFEPVANGLERMLERGASRTYRADVSYDAVILLGGMVERATAPGQPAYNESVERLLVTYDLLRTNRARNAILSGGPLDPPDSFAEAAVLAQQLVDWGIAPERLAIEAHSRNTYENAVESRRSAEEHRWTRLLVVTSAFHMARAEGCFRAVGLPVDTFPVDYRAYDPAHFSGSWLPRAMFLERSTWALREWFGRAIYRVRGYAR
jgi:uncharacterized SAM-binding protein YcdF (DUF218 family)